MVSARLSEEQKSFLASWNIFYDYDNLTEDELFALIDDVSLIMQFHDDDDDQSIGDRAYAIYQALDD